MKGPWSYSLPDWLSIHISLFFINHRGHPYIGTRLELYFHIFYKSLVARNNAYRGLSEGHVYLVPSTYSKIYPCSVPDLGGLHRWSTLFQFLVKMLLLNWTSAVYHQPILKDIIRNSFFEVYYHIYYERRHLIMLDIISIYSITGILILSIPVMRIHKSAQEKNHNVRIFS